MTIIPISISACYVFAHLLKRKEISEFVAFEKQKIADICEGVLGEVFPDFKKRNRTSNVFEKRAFLMEMMRKELGLTCVIIGRIFNKDHSTVVNAIKFASFDLNKKQCADNYNKAVVIFREIKDKLKKRFDDDML